MENNFSDEELKTYRPLHEHACKFIVWGQRDKNQKGVRWRGFENHHPEGGKHPDGRLASSPFQGFLFNDNALANSNLDRETSTFAIAGIYWNETPEAHVFKADLPGLKKEEVKVELEEGRILQISGETSREKEEKDDKWHRFERSSGKFLRLFRLPENAKVNGVKAGMENGVLTVTVPKEQVKKHDVKAIDISS